MKARSRLVVASLLAENTDPLFSDLARFLASELAGDGAPVDVEVAGGTAAERRRGIVDGEAHLAGLCGALYLFDRELAGALELVAAPVRAGADGAAGAVYYADVVVARDHPARRFDDLRGASWAYNEPASHSGYHAIRAHLAALGERDGFFGRAVAAGSHQQALALVLDGGADAAPIDSYVLARELADRPELSGALRVIERIGPSPAPPLAIGTSVPEPLRRRVVAALLHMHELAQGARMLRRHLLTRFAPVAAADYAPILDMVARGEEVELAR